MLNWLLGKEAEVDKIERIFKSTAIDSTCSETKIRNAFTTIFQDIAGYSCKRESGVSGVGTRVDLYFSDADDTDHIVSFKRDLSEQKIKTLLGEAAILKWAWQCRGSAEKLVLWICVLHTKEMGKNLEYSDALLNGMLVIEASRYGVELDIRVVHVWGEDEDLTFESEEARADFFDGQAAVLCNEARY